MRYYVDTWYFIELSKKVPKAVKIINELERKKNELIVPSIIILEMTRKAIRTGKIKVLNELIKSLKAHDRIIIVDCDIDIAEKAGEISATYNIPSVDSIIAATAILTKSHKLISDDSHFKILNKNGMLKTHSW